MAERPRDGLEGVELEIVGERAATIGRLGRLLADSLAALAAHPGGGPARAELVAIAGERLWFYVIQRETMGWHDHQAVLEAYAVPREVQLRMGPRLPAG